MRKCTLASAVLIGLTGAASAHIVQPVPFSDIGSLSDVIEARFPRGAPLANQITCDLTTGVASVGGPCTSGATCNGSADTAPAFKAFNTWARANQGALNRVVLTIAAGDCVFNTNQTITGALTDNQWAWGINNLIVEGAGAALTSLTAGSAGYRLGSGGICHYGLAEAQGCSARIQTVSAGATQITLTSASLAAGYVSRFPNGSSILIGGVDIQGRWNVPFGYPPNNHFFEYRQITAVNAGTGVITLDRPLTNAYLSTWPNYNAGNANEADAGGPATIWVLPSWNVSHEYRGIKVNQSAQNYAEGRSITFRNADFTGCCGLVPSQNESFSAYNSTWTITSSPGWEVDKFIGTITLDTVTIPRVDFQSSSTDLLVMSNSTIGSMFGTPKSSQITDTHFDFLRPGAWTNGVSTGPFVCTRCDVTDFDFQGGASQGTPADYSMSSGVITFANTAADGADPAQRFFVPGGNLYWAPTGWTSIGLFQSTAITQDPTNTYVQTSEAGGFPTLSGFDANFSTHPAPQFTCDACTGDPELVGSTTQQGATALAPLGQYNRRTFTSWPGFTVLANMYVRGRLTELTIDVTTAYVGAGSPILNATGSSGIATVKQSNWTTYSWFPKINLKQAGTRVITPSGITCNGSPGGCSGDTINNPGDGVPPEAVWISSNIFPFLDSTTLSTGTLPVVTMTIKTNQGVVP